MNSGGVCPFTTGEQVPTICSQTNCVVVWFTLVNERTHNISSSYDRCLNSLASILCQCGQIFSFWLVLCLFFIREHSFYWKSPLVEWSERLLNFIKCFSLDFEIKKYLNLRLIASVSKSEGSLEFEKGGDEYLFIESENWSVIQSEKKQQTNCMYIKKNKLKMNWSLFGDDNEERELINNEEWCFQCVFCRKGMCFFHWLEFHSCDRLDVRTVQCICTTTKVRFYPERRILWFPFLLFCWIFSKNFDCSLLIEKTFFFVNVCCVLPVEFVFQTDATNSFIR